MSCTEPLTAIDFGLDVSTGKHRIKIKRPRWNESIAEFRNRMSPFPVVLLPCGHCPSCLLAKRKEWAIRCACEAKYHLHNCFVTLTYDDKHLPKDRKLCKSHLQQFFKNIRNKGFVIRYFACGEYGSKGRPHYHAIIFGLLPDDLQFSHESQSGEHIFTSQVLSACWEHGLAVVQMFSPAAAGYVAGYTNKKFLDQRGFLLMSRKPGIGYNYLMDNFDHIYRYDNIVDDLGSYKIARPSRYFEKLVESLYGPFALEMIKDQRKNKAKVKLLNEVFEHHYIHEEDSFEPERLVASHRINKLRRVI